MLKEYLKKVFNPASAETQEEVISMIKEEDQAAIQAADNTAELTAQLNTVTEALATLQTKYEAAQTALSQSAEAQATLVANAKAAVLTARTASLSAIMGDVKGPLMAASLESLDDAAFAVVLSGYANSFEKEKASPLFNEQGVAADVVVPVETSAVARLAANIAKEFKSE